jgi:photosystem II stability/assembly factor-like uncharacterized protein
MLCATTLILNAQWYKVNVEPKSEILNCIYSVNDELIVSVGDNGTVKRSIDSGLTWTTVRGGYKLSNLNSVSSFNENNIIAVGKYGEIIKSIDKGLTWNELDLNVENHVNDIKIHNNNAVIVGNEGLIYISPDSCKSWQDISVNYNLNLIKLLLIDSTIIIISDTNAILKSTNLGNDWQKIDFNQYYKFYSISKYKNEIYLVGFQTDIITTNNNFITYDIKSYSNGIMYYLNYEKVNDSTIISTVVYSGTSHAYSTNNGSTWIIGYLSEVPTHDIDLSINNSISYICGIQGGIIRLDNNKLEKPLQMFHPLVESGDEMLHNHLLSGCDESHLFSSNDIEAFSSNDSGKKWRNILKLSTDRIIDIFQVFPDNYQVLIDSTEFVQEDGKSYEKHWWFVNSLVNNLWKRIFLDSGAIYKKMQFKSNNGIIVGSIHQFITTNNGANWYKDSLESNGYILDLQLLNNSKVKYICNRNKLMYLVETDIYKSYYNEIPITITGANNSSIYFINQDFGFLLIPNRFDFNKPSEVYRTIDGGKNWNLVLSTSKNLTNGLTKIAFADDNYGICAGNEGLMYHTTDGGLSWFSNSFASYVSVGSGLYYPSKNTAYIIFNEGVFKYDPDTNVDVIDNNTNKNDGLLISPNPVSNKITVKINSKIYIQSKIEIYNLLGIKQKKIDYELISGENSITFDVSDLSSGVYFVVVNDGKEVRKQMFIKE